MARPEDSRHQFVSEMEAGQFGSGHFQTTWLTNNSIEIKFTLNTVSTMLNPEDNLDYDLFVFFLS